MKVYFLARSAKDLRKLPKFDQVAISQKVRLFSNPSISQEEKLSGSINIYRVRVGNYRIVYRRLKTSIDILVIAHRKEVYKLLRDVLR